MPPDFNREGGSGGQLLRTRELHIREYLVAVSALGSQRRRQGPCILLTSPPLLRQWQSRKQEQTDTNCPSISLLPCIARKRRTGACLSTEIAWKSPWWFADPTRFSESIPASPTRPCGVLFCELFRLPVEGGWLTAVPPPGASLGDLRGSGGHSAKRRESRRHRGARTGRSGRRRVSLCLLWLSRRSWVQTAAREALVKH